MENENKNETYINPSLGRIGKMYYDPDNNRIKYFSTDIHQSSKDVEQLVEQGKEMMYNYQATRLNARFFLREDSHNIENIEALIPLNNGHTGIDLLFIGMNHSERMDSEYVINLEDELVDDVLSTIPSDLKNISGEYSVQRLYNDELSNEDINSLFELYSEAFPTYTTVLDTDSIKTMIDNSVVYAVRDKNTKSIVSTSVAEIGTVLTNEGDFKICELSEMATKREYRGKGLVTYATKILIDEIRDEVDLIYGEARASHKAINKSFFNLGFNYAGRLNKQCVLSGDSEIEEKSPYENLNVWYVLPHNMD